MSRPRSRAILASPAFTTAEANAEIRAIAFEALRCVKRLRLKEQGLDAARKLDEELMSMLSAEITNEVMKKDLVQEFPFVSNDGEENEALLDGKRIALMVTEMTEARLAEFEKDFQPAPKTLKFDVQVSSTQGKRSSMEDRHCIVQNLNQYFNLQDQPAQGFFSIYDGHGGVEAADYASKHLHVNLANHPDLKDDPKKALLESFLTTDERFCVKALREKNNSGAVAVSVLVREDKLYVAWVGDSQAVLCKKDETIAINLPHKPERPDEKARIEESGGLVVFFGAWRVNGLLSVARAIGDVQQKAQVIGKPDLDEFVMDDDVQFLLLGCDGLFDVMKPEEATQAVLDHIASTGSREGAAKMLMQQAITKGSFDNVSVVLIWVEKAAR